jgi:hypothetical protein
MVSLRALGDVLQVRTPYDPDFVADLKRLPATDRRFEPSRKVWLVTPNHGQAVADMMLRHFGQLVAVPTVVSGPAKVETRVIEVRYIGTCKLRGGEDAVAYGWTDGNWNVILTESALRDWFGQASRPGEKLSLYAVLSVKPDAADEQIKAAYRRLAKQWHPDVSREPDAAEQFRSIQHAYDVLRDPRVRRKYDAGLKLSGQSKVPSDFEFSASEYRSPLRCGVLLAEGVAKLDKFQVTKIVGWDDIFNLLGQTLVTSWKPGDDSFTEIWS